MCLLIQGSLQVMGQEKLVLILVNPVEHLQYGDNGELHLSRLFGQLLGDMGVQAGGPAVGFYCP